ncbi:DJ-1/PfpI family protein [Pseudomonas lalucatii]|nr:DJ-1/PfpI family protein [Pseudomonas lalucatii]
MAAKGEIASDAGVPVVASHSFSDAWKDPDILFVPGNTLALFDQLENPRILDFLADRGTRAGWITSVCNGSLLLGASGLLHGYKAAAYWYTREYLAHFGAKPVADRVVIDRNRATGGGMTAGIDFGLTMLGHLVDNTHGQLAELIFEYAPEPPYGTGRPELASEETRQTALSIVANLMPVERIAKLKARAAPRTL